MKYGKILSGIAAGTLAVAAFGMMMPKRKKSMFGNLSTRRLLNRSKMWDW